MDRVIDRLWIGSTQDFVNPLRALGFSGVVDLRDIPPFEVDGVEVFRIANRDGDPWDSPQVHLAINFISKQIRNGKVLVACAAGMSRSASMVIGYLTSVGFDSATAYEMTKRARPKIAPVQAMLDSALVVVKL